MKNDLCSQYLQMLNTNEKIYGISFKKEIFLTDLKFYMAQPLKKN